MPSDSATPLDHAMASVRDIDTTDQATSRIITGLTLWWFLFPVALCVGLSIVSGPSPHVFWEGVARVLLWVGLGGAAVAPVAGSVVALARRRRACWRFAAMTALSTTGFVFILLALAQA